MDSVPFRPPPGLSKEADSTRPPRVRTAFTEEQVSTLESSFQHHRYLGPLERRRLAQKMRLSEVQVRPLGSAGQAGLGGWPVRPCDLVFPTDKNLVSESPNETQTPTAGLTAEHPLLWSCLHTLGFLPTTLCPGQLPAAAAPLGIPAWALGSGTAPWLLLGPLPSGTSLPGLGVGLKQQTASDVLPPRSWEPGTHTGPSLVQGHMGPVYSARDRGCLLKRSTAVQ